MEDKLYAHHAVQDSLEISVEEIYSSVDQIIENFHFKRFLYEDGKKLNKKIIEFKLREMGLRLKVRYKVVINEERVIQEIFKKTI